MGEEGGKRPRGDIEGVGAVPRIHPKRRQEGERDVAVKLEGSLAAGQREREPDTGIDVVTAAVLLCAQTAKDRLSNSQDSALDCEVLDCLDTLMGEVARLSQSVAGLRGNLAALRLSSEASNTALTQERAKSFAMETRVLELQLVERRLTESLTAAHERERLLKERLDTPNEGVRGTPDRQKPGEPLQENVVSLSKADQQLLQSVLAVARVDAAKVTATGKAGREVKRDAQGTKIAPLPPAGTLGYRGTLREGQDLTAALGAFTAAHGGAMVNAPAAAKVKFIREWFVDERHPTTAWVGHSLADIQRYMACGRNTLYKGRKCDRDGRVIKSPYPVRMVGARGSMHEGHDRVPAVEWYMAHYPSVRQPGAVETKRRLLAEWCLDQRTGRLGIEIESVVKLFHGGEGGETGHAQRISTRLNIPHWVEQSPAEAEY
ncbi:hypothetical protein KIPB_001882 [Kipferlia bialata]|uniref:Uncharacterized protein n=1 Tax=Kipferlia bialata TaxID=797122 RepID=A0A9K3CQZ1_9EUKA|nr:hypothetical protein KIPB_001882 [Kipferlia bialata]|eukprot:g1882.t1